MTESVILLLTEAIRHERRAAELEHRGEYDEVESLWDKAAALRREAGQTESMIEDQRALMRRQAAAREAR